MDPRISPLNDAERARAVRRVLLVTLVLNVAVAVAKIAYGYMASALSIRADGFHSLTDASNNVVGIVSVAWAARPADKGHPYGHQKIELIAAGFVGALLLFVAYDVVHGAIDRLIKGVSQAPTIDGVSFLVLGLTLLVNIGVASYESKRGKQLGSSFLTSDATHTKSDIAVTLGVIVSVAFVRGGFAWVDILAALFVAGFIAWAGLAILRQNWAYLADAAQLDHEGVEAAVLAVPGVASAHRIRTRGVPGSVYVDLHIQIAPHLNVVEAHEVTHWVIDAIKERFAGVRDVLVHTEPAESDQAFVALPPRMRMNRGDVG